MECGRSSSCNRRPFPHAAENSGYAVDIASFWSCNHESNPKLRIRCSASATFSSESSRALAQTSIEDVPAPACARLSTDAPRPARPSIPAIPKSPPAVTGFTAQQHPTCAAPGSSMQAPLAWEQMSRRNSSWAPTPSTISLQLSTNSLKRAKDSLIAVSSVAPLARISAVAAPKYSWFGPVVSSLNRWNFWRSSDILSTAKSICLRNSGDLSSSWRAA
mmetsp:Transcript_40570/g.91354  ORF Transcript_40570/g.91354 Transcript_40570/m.91354 type:complete len:218 (+) Transcript_40570:484-1137(+)